MVGTPQAQHLPHSRMRWVCSPHPAPGASSGGGWRHNCDQEDQAGACCAEDAAVSRQRGGPVVPCFCVSPVLRLTPQRYGAPSASDIKDSFQRRYVTSR